MLVKSGTDLIFVTLKNIVILLAAQTFNLVISFYNML